MNFTIFQYPKSKHIRTYKPRVFRTYRTYKRWLQQEFSRTCVYCRQPDSSAPNLNFGVDHYRPKAIPKFANLVCDYTNLYYCCGLCNSRKNADWPIDEALGPYVVNPCDHVMSQHLRFDASTGTMVTRTIFGKHTEELLQLNDEALVKYRKTTLHALKIASIALDSLKSQKSELSDFLRQGKISQPNFDREILDIEAEYVMTDKLIESLTGKTPLPPLVRVRLGVPLI